MTSRLHTAYRVTGHGPYKVLLLHALTGGPDAADREGIKGWWNQVFQPGAPLDPQECTVWTPNLLGSCYGTTGPTPGNTRDQALALKTWIEEHNLSFDLLLGASLGGMVALELALLAPERFNRVAVIGSGARSDAWICGTSEIQLAILRNPALSDDDAIGLARRAAMLSFRSPESISARFKDNAEITDWLAFHGKALADRFTREAFITLLTTMSNHDVGRDRGGLEAALGRIQAPVHILGMESDLLISPERIIEIHTTLQKLGLESTLDWVQSPHGHDAFLMEWQQVKDWLQGITHLAPQASCIA